jgi:transcriptional regulator with XRE-family HTH domain
MNVIGFSEWLKNELEIRGMSQADLARDSNISAPQISRIISMHSSPGENTLRAIAHAFSYPPDFVFRKAGLLPEISEDPPELQELRNLYLSASKNIQHEILDFARYKIKNSN